MEKMYLVTLFFATNQKIYSIKMLRAFFPFLGLADAKEAVEKLIGQTIGFTSGNFTGQEVKIVVTAEEYAAYWVGAKRDAFGDCRVRNIQPLELPEFYRPK